MDVEEILDLSQNLGSSSPYGFVFLHGLGQGSRSRRKKRPEFITDENQLRMLYFAHQVRLYRKAPPKYLRPYKPTCLIWQGGISFCYVACFNFDKHHHL